MYLAERELFLKMTLTLQPKVLFSSFRGSRLSGYKTQMLGTGCWALIPALALIGSKPWRRYLSQPGAPGTQSMRHMAVCSRYTRESNPTETRIKEKGSETGKENKPKALWKRAGHSSLTLRFLSLANPIKATL